MNEERLYLSSTLRASISGHVLRRDFRPVYPGVMARRDVEPTFALRSKALAMLYPDGVLVGPSAAVLWGARLDPGTFHPEIALPGSTHRRRGVQIRRFEVPARDRHRIGSVQVTTQARTLVDLARFHPEESAVLAIEAMLHAGGIKTALRRDPTSALDEVGECWAAGRARSVLSLASVLSESPWETRTRLTFHRAGIVGFVPQVVVPELGYRLDLAHEEAKVAVEYDGAHHRDGRQQAADAERRNRLQAEGWIVITVTAPILMGRQEEFLAQVRDALESRGF